jgi:hypothetical protein
VVHHHDRGKRARDIGTQIGHDANPLLASADRKSLIGRAAYVNKPFVKVE